MHDVRLVVARFFDSLSKQLPKLPKNKEIADRMILEGETLKLAGVSG